MADNKIQMPQSGGGIVRYFDDFKSKIEFSPWVIIGVIIFIIILELLLHKINLLGF
ncbi:MAG: preprotein translocase subunit Sec61beta [Candidatus Woesearchaeota archaeon]